ncbi:MAG TPA: hypothetical protein VKW76_01615 [Candidatus Binatia bacterium]|nr:hypothetical protein [Candidatus Binatia bacterium]
MSRRPIMLALAVPALLAFGRTTVGHASKAPLCAGRFVMPAQVFGDGVAGPEIIAVEGRKVAIGTVCPAISVVLRGSHRATVLRAAWPEGACSGIGGRVRLKATIVQGCSLMKATLAEGKHRHQVKAPLSTCGDGVVDAGNGEQCDGAGCGVGEACVRCACVPAGGGTTTSTTVLVASTTTTTVPCAPLQFSCGGSSQCCAPGLCSGGTCCAPSGQPCQDSTDCCTQCCDPGTLLCTASSSQSCL